MKWLQQIILEIFRYPILGLWYLSGWRTESDFPPDEKLVLTGAPHTSNWDYIVALLAAYEQRRRLNVTIKSELFFPPLGWILRGLGGVPIERSKSQNLVDQIADRFNETDRMIMIFTPEGTRSYTDYWKTGFYWAAVEAKVRILCVAINWEQKRVHFGLVFEPSGDIEADFEKIKAYQEKYGSGLKPENESKIALRPRKTEDEVTVA